ncbi:hypothetical protein DFR40_2236 [Azonexus fungiphilus]|uniref:DUF1289 domain-containing protein n=1 Tax=Azonexus fungiphilus TaxID=146940 RepID=A0A495VQ24_9RHOO|nr:DUF1289 domain-containing protein [Azonexus fungiphilus]RKT51030.1 hypothetical protein DFR40_2236 [Azonexus fungiphilus]
MNENQESRYQCVGICMTDPDSGYCLGCGRPPEDSPTVVAEIAVPTPEAPHPGRDPDTPA